MIRAEIARAYFSQVEIPESGFQDEVPISMKQHCCILISFQRQRRPKSHKRESFSSRCGARLRGYVWCCGCAQHGLWRPVTCDLATVMLLSKRDQRGRPQPHGRHREALPDHDPQLLDVLQRILILIWKQHQRTHSCMDHGGVEAAVNIQSFTWPLFSLPVHLCVYHLCSSDRCRFLCVIGHRSTASRYCSENQKKLRQHLATQSTIVQERSVDRHGDRV